MNETQALLMFLAEIVFFCFIFTWQRIRFMKNDIERDRGKSEKLEDKVRDENRKFDSRIYDLELKEKYRIKKDG